jgi:hypothetical protein
MPVLRTKHRTHHRADIRAVRTSSRGKLGSLSKFYIGPSLCAVCGPHTALNGTPMSRFEWEHIPPSVVYYKTSHLELLPVGGKCGACSCIYNPKPNFQIPYLHSERLSIGLAKARPAMQVPRHRGSFFISPPFFCSAKSMLRCLVCGPASTPHSRSKPKSHFPISQVDL